MQQSAEHKQPLEHLQPSVLIIVIKLLAGLFVLDTLYAFIVIGFFSLDNFHEWHPSYIFLLWFAHTAKYLIISFLIIRLFTDWVGRAYYLTGHHLIERLGLINITETTHELSQVKSIILQQSWLGRRFNFGTIKLSFAGSGGQEEVIMKDINNPARYKQYFDEHLQVQGWVR